MMTSDKPKQQYREPIRDYDEMSTAEKVVEILYRSTKYRPSSPAFIPISIAVALITGCIWTVVGVSYIYIDAR